MYNPFPGIGKILDRGIKINIGKPGQSNNMSTNINHKDSDDLNNNQMSLYTAALIYTEGKNTTQNYVL